MILRNWINALVANVMNVDIPSVLKATDGTICTAYATPTDNLLDLIPTYGANLNLKTNYTTANSGIILGTGRVAPTYDDYCLSGSVISTVSFTKTLSELAGTTVTNTAIYTITNTGTSPITINEVAYCANLYVSTSKAYRFLLERTVLPVPLVVEPGGVAQLTYKISAPTPGKHSA